jgi:hypothetical protein
MNIVIPLANNTNDIISRIRMAGMVSLIQNIWPGKHHVPRTTFAFISYGDWDSIIFCPLSFEFPRRKYTLSHHPEIIQPLNKQIRC